MRLGRAQRSDDVPGDRNGSPIGLTARSPGHEDPTPEDQRQHESPALLDALHLESLILNLDASLRVHARTHFFTWTQGLLQSLIRHKVMICALCNSQPQSLRADSFSTLVPDAAVFSGLLLRDASVARSLIEAWKERQFLPVICEPADIRSLAGGAFARELQRVGATQIAVHGSHDADGEASSLFVFGCESGAIGPEQSYLLQLVVPFLHSAWIRSQIRETTESVRSAPAELKVLTAREQEILRWIYLGKSNGEVGAILKISPLTVKNHVQKILRKLNVVNRTQAVGKALDARILNP